MVVEVRFVRKYVSQRQFPSGTLLSGCDIRAIYTARHLFAIKDVVLESIVSVFVRCRRWSARFGSVSILHSVVSELVDAVDDNFQSDFTIATRVACGLLDVVVIWSLVRSHICDHALRRSRFSCSIIDGGSCASKKIFAPHSVDISRDGYSIKTRAHSVRYWRCPMAGNKHGKRRNKDIIAARSMLIIALTLWSTGVRPIEFTPDAPTAVSKRRRKQPDSGGDGDASAKAKKAKRTNQTKRSRRRRRRSHNHNSSSNLRQQQRQQQLDGGDDVGDTTQGSTCTITRSVAPSIE
jgi:hypothetical protein